MQPLSDEQSLLRKEKLEYHRRYYVAHALEQKAAAKQWRKNHPEECAKQAQIRKTKYVPYGERSEEEKKKAREATRRWRKNNPDKYVKSAELTKAKKRVRYATDPEYRETAKARSRRVMPTVQRARRAKLKGVVFAHYGAVCACCGETQELFLTLDHVNNDGAKHRKEIYKTNGRGGNTAGLYLDIIRRNFPPDFQILCYNCNCGRFRNGGVCPHESDRLNKEPRLTDAITGLPFLAAESAPTAAPGRENPGTVVTLPTQGALCPHLKASKSASES